MRNEVKDMKFVSECEKFEAVYNKNAVSLTEHNDPVNMGTYNYIGSGDFIDDLGHTFLDVVPWGLPHLWGNIPNQPFINPLSTKYREAEKEGTSAYEYWHFIDRLVA
jgi:hypothetical protein